MGTFNGVPLLSQVMEHIMAGETVMWKNVQGPVQLPNVIQVIVIQEVLKLRVMQQKKVDQFR